MAVPYKRADPKGKDKKPNIIIVKRVKKTAAAHHGGAWKVAYADFVTAMMAFFLMLWLLSTSSEATLQGIAEYFTPVTGVANNRPIGTNNTSSPNNNPDKGINMSTPGVAPQEQGSIAGIPEKPSPVDSEQQDMALFERGASAINQAINNDPAMSKYKDNVQVLQTPEGLRVDLRDAGKYPMFIIGTTTLTEHGQAILAGITPLLKRMPNYMAITGYTDGSLMESDTLKRWEISTGRAESSLKYMMGVGLERERTQKLQGVADNEMISSDDPRSGRNRRITLLLLRGSHILVPTSAIPGAE